MFSITTDCTLDSLEATVSSDSSECGERNMTADIPNGMLCYTGLTPGSTATYHCDKGYELSGTSIVLQCLPNGVWNSVAPTCVQLDTGTNINFFFFFQDQLNNQT